MLVRPEFHVLDPAPLQDFHAQAPRSTRQLVLERAAVDLLVVVRRVAGGALLDALGDVLVAGGGEEEPQPDLDQLVLFRWSSIPTTFSK